MIYAEVFVLIFIQIKLLKFVIIFNETEYRADGSFKAHVTNHRQNIGHSSGLQLVEIISIGTCACASLLITTVFLWKYFVCKSIILNTF